MLSYKANDNLLLYASYSRGYKAAATTSTGPTSGRRSSPPTNADATATCVSLRKSVDAWEAGFKFSRRGFLFNAAVFYEKFKDFQLNTFNGTVFIVQNINSCSTNLNGADQDQSATTGACAAGNVRAALRRKGIELESTWTPMRVRNV